MTLVDSQKMENDQLNEGILVKKVIVLLLAPQPRYSFD